VADAFSTTRAWGEVCSRATQRVQRLLTERGVIAMYWLWVGRRRDNHERTKLEILGSKRTAWLA
jgi:hypothetical protein